MPLFFLALTQWAGGAAVAGAVYIVSAAVILAWSSRAAGARTDGRKGGGS